MVGVNGIVSVPEPSNVRKTEASAPRTDGAAARGAADGVKISREAHVAAEAVQAARVDSAGAQIRAERVEQAKRNLEQGAHRVQEVVKLVAARMANQLVP